MRWTNKGDAPRHSTFGRKPQALTPTMHMRITTSLIVSGRKETTEQGKRPGKPLARFTNEQRTMQKKNHNADYFHYYGSAVHENIGETEKAEQIFREGLTIDPEHTGILASLMGLYLERHDIPPIEKPVNHGRYQEQKPSPYWMVRESFRKAEQILKTKTRKKMKPFRTSSNLGHSIWVCREYDQAKDYYEKALKKDPESWAINVGLGVICSRREDFRQGGPVF